MTDHTHTHRDRNQFGGDDRILFLKNLFILYCGIAN